MPLVDPQKHVKDLGDANLPSLDRTARALCAQIYFEAFDQGIPIVKSMTRQEFRSLIESNPQWADAILQRPISEEFREFFNRRWRQLQLTKQPRLNR